VRTSSLLCVQKALSTSSSRPFSKTKSIALADFFAFLLLLFPRLRLLPTTRTLAPHFNSLSLSLSSLFLLSSLRKARRLTITMLRRRRTDEENEEDNKKEEESASSVGTAFGKIWECYCALSCLFFFSLRCVLSLSLSPVFVVFGKML